jgi:hypothetical protein
LLVAFPIALGIAMATLPSQNYNAAISAGQDRPDKKKESEDNQIPVATFAASDPADPAGRDLRRVRSSRHDKRRPQPLSELPAGIEELPLNSHWAWGMVALPSTQSDAVVIGEVTDAQAYLSNDRTGVYSEFTVRVKEVLKNLNQVSLTPSEVVILEREGGAVRFPSGRVQRYRIVHQGIPLVGRQYVLFLKYNDQAQSFSILTGYELHKGRVVPLDSLDQFAVYKGTDENSFLNAVRDSIAYPSRYSLRKAGK